MDDTKYRDALASLDDDQYTAVKGAICPYCKASLPMILKSSGDKEAEFEHFIPLTDHSFPCLAMRFIREWCKATSRRDATEENSS